MWGFIDPPSPFDPIEVWLQYLADLRTLPQDEEQIQEAIRDAEETIARIKVEAG